VVVDHDAPFVSVRVHKPGALRFADTVGVVIKRCPDDYRVDESVSALPVSDPGGSR